MRTMAVRVVRSIVVMLVVVVVVVVVADCHHLRQDTSDRRNGTIINRSLEYGRIASIHGL